MTDYNRVVSDWWRAIRFSVVATLAYVVGILIMDTIIQQHTTPYIYVGFFVGCLFTAKCFITEYENKIAGRS